MNFRLFKGQRTQCKRTELELFCKKKKKKKDEHVKTIVSRCGKTGRTQTLAPVAAVRRFWKVSTQEDSTEMHSNLLRILFLKVSEAHLSFSSISQRCRPTFVLDRHVPFQWKTLDLEVKFKRNKHFFVQAGGNINYVNFTGFDLFPGARALANLRNLGLQRFSPHVHVLKSFHGWAREDDTLF